MEIFQLLCSLRAAMTCNVQGDGRTALYQNEYVVLLCSGSIAICITCLLAARRNRLSFQRSVCSFLSHFRVCVCVRCFLLASLALFGMLSPVIKCKSARFDTPLRCGAKCPIIHVPLSLSPDLVSRCSGLCSRLGLCVEFAFLPGARQCRVCLLVV